MENNMLDEEKYPLDKRYPRSDWEIYHRNEEAKQQRNVAWNNFYPSAISVPGAPFEEIVRQIALEAADILIKKHQDYGPDNINNAPGGATNGLLVRMHDKMERLKTLILGKKEPKYESVEDTLIDMINYSIIGLMVQRGKWPK